MMGWEGSLRQRQSEEHTFIYRGCPVGGGGGQPITWGGINKIRLHMERMGAPSTMGNPAFQGDFINKSQITHVQKVLQVISPFLRDFKIYTDINKNLWSKIAIHTCTWQSKIHFLVSNLLILFNCYLAAPWSNLAH